MTWEIDTNIIGQQTIWDEDHYCVATVIDAHPDAKANARKIAAAPDGMELAMLIDRTAQIDYDGTYIVPAEVLQLAQDFIAKVTGSALEA